MHLIPAAFCAKKQRIVSALAVPDAEYSDLSPKGSIDEGIRDLINKINSIDGIVTTSSCAGRISVFLEGSKAPKQASNASESHEVDHEAEEQHRSVPGGKGKGGRWLFVSHKPVIVPERSTDEDKPVIRLFGLSPQKMPGKVDPTRTRFVRFQFEPMVDSVHPKRVLKLLFPLTQPDSAHHDSLSTPRRPSTFCRHQCRV